MKIVGYEIEDLEDEALFEYYSKCFWMCVLFVVITAIIVALSIVAIILGGIIDPGLTLQIIIAPIVCCVVIFFPFYMYFYKRMAPIKKEITDRGLLEAHKADLRDKKETYIVGVVLLAIVVVGSITFKCISNAVNDANENSSGCKNCGRTTDLVAGFGYCSDCYDGFVDWQEDNWKED